MAPRQSFFRWMLFIAISYLVSIHNADTTTDTVRSDSTQKTDLDGDEFRGTFYLPTTHIPLCQSIIVLCVQMYGIHISRGLTSQIRQ